MRNTEFWKYCTKEQCLDFILSLHLLPGKRMGTANQEERRRQLSCLYMLAKHKEDYYHELRIPKKDGGVRTLLAPCGLLKAVQKNILHHVLDGRSISPYACAYHRGTSLSSNAEPHVGARMVMKLDIRHFFDSIIFPQVYTAAFPKAYFPPAAAALLTGLCCYRDRLPQGAPTSPAVSNLVMKGFDGHMGSWCRERGIVYTRYCDDMTFSGDFDAAAVYRKVRSFLLVMGFELNEEKTTLTRRGQRQLVTGIVVNEKPQVPREMRRKLRQEIYFIQKYGVEEHLRRMRRCNAADAEKQSPEPSGTCTPDSGLMPGGEFNPAASIACAPYSGTELLRDRYLESLAGRLQFVLQVNPRDEEFLEYKRQWHEITGSLKVPL